MVDFRWADPMDAYDQAYKRTNALFDDAAQKAAGAAFERGDYTGAAGTLAKRGDVQGAAAITEYGTKTADRARKQSDDDKRREATGALARNDFSGAKELYGSIGDAEGVNSTQTAAANLFKAQREYGQQVAPVLSKLYEVGGADAFNRAIDALGPDLKRLGHTDDEIVTLQVRAKQDPKAYLAALNETITKDYDFRTVGDETQVLDKTTGKLVGRYVGTKFISLNDTDSLVQVGGPGGASSQPGAAADAPQPASGAAGDPKQPRGLRNNNPLNVTNLAGGQKWQGQVGDDGRYAKFGSVEDGWRAADRNLQTYATKYGLKNLNGIIRRWAPAGENNPAAYAASVGKLTGYAPDQNLDLNDPAVRRNVLEAMAHVENGRPVSQVAASAPDAAPEGGARILVRGQPKPDKPQERWEPLPDGKGQRNVATGEIKALPGAQGGVNSVGDVIAPILAKVAAKGQNSLSDSEAEALAIYRRMSPDEREDERIAAEEAAAARAAEGRPPPAPAPKPTTTAAPRRTAPPAPGARLARDGNWYVADPQRPGKYLKVQM